MLCSRGLNIRTPPKVVTVVGLELQCLLEIYDGLPVHIYVPDFKLDILSSSEPSFSATLRGWFIQQNTLRRNWSRR